MNKEKIYPSSPLGMIALFVFFIEAIATVSLKFLVEYDSKELPYIIQFIIWYPTLISMLFFATLWFKRECLFAPSDFREEKNFLDLFKHKITMSMGVVTEKDSAPPKNQATESVIKYANALSYADAALTSAKVNPEHLVEASELLYEVHNSRKTDKVAAIYLARVLRQQKKYSEAIEVLASFIKSTDEVSAKADAYYNAACYYSLWYGQSKNSTYKEEAISALKASIAMNDKIKEYMIKDPDFVAIKDDSDFIALLNH